MATRTRVPTRTIEDILAGALDVIDRADRLLGKVDLIRYMGILCGPANPIDTQIIVGGFPVDPRARTWVLNQFTDSVQVAPLLGGVWDVSDRWARQLGQVDLARVLGAALTSANPVIVGIYDALGNRMPSMDVVARAGYVDVIDRAARLLGTVSPVAGSVWDVSDRWARQLGLVDLSRVLGAALSATNPVIAGIYDAVGNRMPTMDAVARPGYIDVIDRAARLLGVVYGSQAQQILQRAVTFDLLVQLRNAGVEIDPRSIRALSKATDELYAVLRTDAGVAYNGATEATLGTVHGHVDSIDAKLVSGTDIGDVTVNNAAGAAAVNVQDGGNSLTVDGSVAVTGTLTQSTKHDAKVYAPAIFDAAASGNLVAAVANKVTKLHALAIQAQGTVVVNLNDGNGGASLMEWSFQAREGAVLALAPSPAYWAVTSVNTILYVTLSAAVQVTITAIVSSDDAA